MIWLVWITTLISLAVMIFSLRELRRLIVQVAAMKYDMGQYRVRQGKLKMQQGAVPLVDAKAKTTVRDSHDLPHTARQSVAVHRERVQVDSPTP